jgi:hypothetical protein
MKNNPANYYSLLCNATELWPSPYEHQINLDLLRTCPEDPYFQSKDILKSLKRILLAYTRRNQSIGYCQGFNFIAARLLKVLRNEVLISHI